jgi:hypothetical protein
VDGDESEKETCRELSQVSNGKGGYEMPRSCFTENALLPLSDLAVPRVRDQGHGQSGGGSVDSEGNKRSVRDLNASWRRDTNYKHQVSLVV